MYEDTLYGHEMLHCGWLLWWCSHPSPTTLHTGEGQKPSFTTYSQLRGRVASIASALRACGVTKGDRVVGYLPNCTLAVEAMLATSSIGAVWSSTSPDFGVTVSLVGGEEWGWRGGEGWGEPCNVQTI